MKGKIIIILATIPLIILLSGCSALFGGGSEPETITPTTPGTLAAITELQNGIVSLGERVSVLETNSTGTPDVTAFQAELAQLRTDLDALSAKVTENEAKMAEMTATIAGLNTRIVALEQPTGGIAPETTCRWYCEIYNLNHLGLLGDGVTPEVQIDYSTSPAKIQEADDYTVYVDIYNNSTTAAINDLQVEVTFTPKTGARVIVDEDEIFLDTTAAPYYAWETEIETRTSDATCRRITFDATGIKVAKGVLVDSTLTPGLTHLKLTFTLAYK